MIELTNEKIEDALECGNVVYLDKVPLLSDFEEYRYTLPLVVEGYENNTTCRISITLAKSERGVEMWWYPKENENKLHMNRIHKSFFDDETKAKHILKLKAKKILDMICTKGLRYRADKCGDKDWYIGGKTRVYYNDTTAE